MDAAALVAGKIRGELARPIDIGAGAALATASIGIAIHPHDGDSGQRLLRHADAAMYLDKRQRRTGTGVAPVPALSN
jgi:GGDEF domain-containing protein